jgi:type IV pilus assembly protein PilW
MKITMHSLARFHPQRGRSLIEMLIALIVGAIVLGGVLLSSINSSRTQNQQNSSAYLSEEAQIATNLLTWHLRVAGYSEIVAPPKPQVFGEIRQVYRNYDGPPVRGCDGGMNNPQAAQAAIACSGGAGPDALMVSYEANPRSTIPTNGNPNNPTDCLGQAITALTPSDGNPASPGYFLAQNTFYVSQNNLMCFGNGGNANAAQPLVSNVVDMQVLYGVAGVPAVAPGNTPVIAEPYFEPAQYLTASQVDALVEFPQGIQPAYLGRWNRVVSVRVCLTLRTAEEVYTGPQQYAGCDGNMVMPPDKRAYRVVTINTALKNKTAPCADVGAAPGASKPSFDRCAI